MRSRAKQQRRALFTAAFTGLIVIALVLAVIAFLQSGGSRRLVAVMIENHEDARSHQAGLEHALLIEEFLVEGGISRFAAVFDLADLPGSIGPVRSLRPYFIDGLLPWAGAILFAGGSPEALDRVASEDAVVHANGLGFPKHFLRDETIAAPHNLFTTDALVYDLLRNDEIRETHLPLFPIGPLARSASTTDVGERATEIRLNFFSPLHNVVYEFQPFSGTYGRVNGDVRSHAQPRNILVLEAPITGTGEHGRLEIPLRGGGRALLFRGGTVLRVHWRKDDAHSALRVSDDRGHSISFAHGQTWMTILPTLERVTWE